MLQKPPSPPHREVFADPTPLGLIGLAVGCAALTPIAFGKSLTPAGFETAAMFCLLFGAGCQLVAGILNLANRNLYGGTLFTAFAFNWTMNWWALSNLAKGIAPDHGVVLATELCFLVVFLVITYGFGFYSKVLFLFLLDIDVLFVAKVTGSLLGTQALAPVVAVCTVALAAIALWIAFAILINPTAGRAVFPIAGPLFTPHPTPSFDEGPRRAIFEALYSHWREHAYRPMGVDELSGRVGTGILPHLHYLKEAGGLAFEGAGADGQPAAVRLTATGIDVYEQRVLQKVA